MSSFNSFRDNYPTGFSGLDGQKEEVYIFELGGEVVLTAPNEEDALEELQGMTIKEALENGVFLA